MPTLSSAACGVARARRAFTLIELLVVILIVAVLIAVALPSFLGQTSKAYDSAVQQRLSVARTEAKAIWTSAGQSGYPSSGTLAGELQNAEPSYAFVSDDYANDQAGSPDASKQSIGVAVGPGPNTVTLCQESQSGTYFCLRADETAQLIALPGSGGAAAPARSLLAPASASAQGGYTDILYSTASDEGDAVCVLNAGTPANGGTGTVTGCGTGQAGWATSASASASIQTVARPVLTGAAPAITGAAAASIGTTITASPGGWSNAASFTYQWQDCTSAGTSCSPISQATGSSYTLQPSDVGQAVAVTVTATSAQGQTASATSTPTVLIPSAQTAYDRLVAQSNPVLYFPFDNTGTATVGQTGSDTATGWAWQGASSVTTGVAGALGTGDGAATLGSSSSYLLGTPNTNVGGNYTVESWVKVPAGGGKLFGGRSATSGGDFYYSDLSIGGANSVNVDLGTGSGGTWSVVAGSVSYAPGFVTGAWYYVALVVSQSAGTYTIYVNGQPIGGGSVSSTAATQLLGKGVPFAVGYDNLPGDPNLNGGSLDDFAVYNTALSSSTIASHYDAADLAPAFSSAPQVTPTSGSGIAVGGVLSASGGGQATNAATVSYAWQSSADGGSTWQAIGATGATLNVSPSLAGDEVRYAETATNSLTSTTSTSNVVSVPNDTYAASVLASSPAGYWRFNAGSPTASLTAGKSSVAAATLSGSGSPTFSDGGPASDGDGEVTFPTTGQTTVSLPTGIIPTAAGSNWTTEMWFQWSGSFDSSGVATLLSVADYALVIYKTSATTACLGFDTSSGGSGSSATFADCFGASFPDTALEGSWHHVVGEFVNGTPTSSTTGIWLDGQKQTLTQIVGSATSRSYGGQSDTAIRLGHTRAPNSVFWDLDGGQFYGSIAELAVYGSAPASGMAATHYAAR